MVAGPEAYDAVIDTPVGRLAIRLRGGAVCAVDRVSARFPFKRGAGPAARRAARELGAYFRYRRPPRIEVALAGTVFQRRVWRALCRIPWGSTVTYGQLAHQLDSGPRAVANACRANPVPVAVPCHRVVASNGLGGYMGASSGPGPAMKQWLIDHERG